MRVAYRHLEYTLVEKSIKSIIDKHGEQILVKVALYPVGKSDNITRNWLCQQTIQQTPHTKYNFK
jgi:hypothetical protein